MARCLAEREMLLHCWGGDEERILLQREPFAVLPEGQRCLRGLDDVLDLLHACKTAIYFSVACWIPYYIFILRSKDVLLEPNGRRAHVLRGHGCNPCHLIMYLAIF